MNRQKELVNEANDWKANAVMLHNNNQYPESIGASCMAVSKLLTSVMAKLWGREIERYVDNWSMNSRYGVIEGVLPQGNSDILKTVEEVDRYLKKSTDVNILSKDTSKRILDSIEFVDEYVSRCVKEIDAKWIDPSKMRRINRINKLKIPKKYRLFLLEILQEFKESGHILDNTEDIVLFGSCARGETRRNSDIDIAFITKDKISWEEELEYCDYIPYESENSVTVDLLVMSHDDFWDNIYEPLYVTPHIYKDGISLIGLMHGKEVARHKRRDRY